MIQFLLLQNRQGKTRLSKYYRNFSDDERLKMEADIHRIVTTRDPKFTNFVEVRASLGRPRGAIAPRRSHRRAARRDRRGRRDPLALSPSEEGQLMAQDIHDFLLTCQFVSLFYARVRRQYSNYKLIYRRYAGLFFTLCVDVNDNELLYFESIHLFVELLDQFFGNVCELDLVFNFNKVYMILDEFFLAGEVQETSKQGSSRRIDLATLTAPAAPAPPSPHRADASIFFVSAHCPIGVRSDPTPCARARQAGVTTLSRCGR